ncbi:MAG TPA: hypothetical protein VJ962_03840 [Clostridia bacterium]|nr:hypothetical protein [Clostridia bacterium]
MIIKTDSIQLNSSQILKYIGYSNKVSVDQQTEAEIEEGTKIVKKLLQPKYIFKKYNSFSIFDGHLKLNDHFIIESDDLCNHLKEAKSIVILAVTLGMKVEQLIKREMLINPSKGLIIDAIASEYVEKCANEACNMIINEELKFRNTRFSPGYGDLSLKIQEKIIEVLDTERKMGLYSNDSFLLLPSKSITAFFGLFDRKKTLKKSCKNCQSLGNCRYRDEGVFCYDQTME